MARFDPMNACSTRRQISLANVTLFCALALGFVVSSKATEQQPTPAAEASTAAAAPLENPDALVRGVGHTGVDGQA